VALSVAACDSEEDDENVPEPTGATVWQHLQQEDYRQNWDLWPGTEALYEGSDPHGMLLTTYVNDIALQAITNQSGDMPDGAIIVKENYMPDSTFDAVTTMFKVDGYNSNHNDWFWVKQSPSGVVEVEGRAEGCQSCHQAVAENDYLFTGPIR
jgi:hypothetical protein